MGFDVGRECQVPDPDCPGGLFHARDQSRVPFWLPEPMCVKDESWDGSWDGWRHPQSPLP